MKGKLSGYTHGNDILEASSYIISHVVDKKILVKANCAKCNLPGMAYEDPNSKEPKAHYCIKCNPIIVRK